MPTYKFTGEAPEEFPTLAGDLVAGGRADAVLEPGDEITVTEEVEHPRLELVGAPQKKPAATPEPDPVPDAADAAETPKE